MPEHGQKATKYTLITLLVLAGAGIFVWQQFRIHDLSTKIKEQEFLLTSSSKNANAGNSAISVGGSETGQLAPNNTTGSDGTDIKIPPGWANAGNGMLTKVINGIEYRIQVNLTDGDYLKGNFGGSASVIKKTVTAKGTTAYIIKTANAYAAISSCLPESGKGCSFMMDSQPLFALLYSWKQGDKNLRELNFNAAETNQAIKEFEGLANSLQI